ncbi:MAG: Ig-like domain-containing protein [Pirellulaceae bacterium]|nr:Ig-like domain-containing protein [Pirellulaceae bacterium]
MSTFRRPQVRPGNARQRRRSFLKSHNPLLRGGEQLEPRTMMASDVGNSVFISDYWNANRPADVNDDGAVNIVDLLGVVNALVRDGARNLSGRTINLLAPAGAGPIAEGEEAGGGASTAPTLYIDPNNDAKLNILDLLKVVNTMTAEGEDHEPMVKYFVEAVAQGTNTPITSVAEGQSFELRVSVQDTGILTYEGLTRLANEVGVVFAGLDVNWNTSRASIQTNEWQRIQFNGAGTGTTFQIAFGGQQTGVINFSTNSEATRIAIQNALLGLPLIGRTPDGRPNFQVDYLGVQGRYRVQFLNELANVNQPDMVVTLVNPGPATGVTVTEDLFDPQPETADFLRERAVLPHLVMDADFDSLYLNSPLNFGTIFIPPNSFANGLNDIGGLYNGILNTPRQLSGTEIVEMFRVRLDVQPGAAGSSTTFAGSVQNLSDSLATVLNFGPASDPENAIIAAADIHFDSNSATPALDPDAVVNFVAATVSTTIDAESLTGSQAFVNIPVLSNDNGPGTLTIAGFTQPGAGRGTVTQQGSVLRYTPPANPVSGEVVFYYRASNGSVNSALTKVTVNVVAGNAAPTATAPPSYNATEQVVLNLVGTGLSVADSDAGLAPVTATLSVTSGIITADANGSGLVVTNSGTGSVTLRGRLDQINDLFSGTDPDAILTYINNSNTPPATATLTLQINDEGNTGTGGAKTGQATSTINIAPVNDAPVNSVPGAQEIIIGETFAFTGGAAISIADVDAATGTMTVTLTTNSTTGGTLGATATGGALVTGNNSQNLVVSGQLGAVNATLATLIFQAASAETVTLTIVTSDNGNTGPTTETDTDTVTLNVVDTFRAQDDSFPRAIDNAANFQEGVVSVLLDVLANDSAHTGETLSFNPAALTQPVIASGEFAGEVTIEGNQIRYTLPAGDPDFYGTITFTYGIVETDNAAPFGDNNGTLTATVTVVIANVNDDPVGQPDDYVTDEDQTLTVSDPALGVLGNDTDPDNRPNRAPVDTLTAQLVAAPPASAGTLTLNPNGTFTFVPAADFYGQTSFTYNVLDGKGGSDGPITVTIDIAPTADDPIGVADDYDVAEGGTLVVSAQDGLLANDTDPDNLTPPLNAGLTVDLASVSVLSPAQGTLSVNADGSFTYSLAPSNDFDGQVTFTYQAIDGTGRRSAPTTVTIDITPVNDAPVAADGTYNAVENLTLTVNQANGLLRSTNPLVTDVDTARANLTVQVVTPPAVGSLTLNPNGSFSYTPPAEFNGPVTFTYRAFDGSLFSNTATITIDVAEVNDPPVAQPKSFNTNEDTAIIITDAQLLAGATDPEGNALSVSFVGNLVGSGSLVDNGDGTYTYTPAPGFPAPSLSGQVTFQYRLTDGPNQSNTATATITVTEVNDDPIADDDRLFRAIKDINNQLVTLDLLDNDSSGQDVGVPGEVLSIQSVSATSAQGGTVTLVGQQVRYSPPAGYTGPDSFTYTLSDGRGGTDTATVEVEVLAFVPKSVSGKVFIDDNNDGLHNGSDKPIAGVQIKLVGTGLLGPVSLQVMTDASGNYSFGNLAPGTYTITQVQPDYLASGKDRAASTAANLAAVTNASATDNLFSLDWEPDDFNGNITGLDFGERGIDAGSLMDASGLIAELLASSGQTGMVLVTSTGGTMDWSYSLSGWNTTVSLQLEFGAGGSIPSALLTIGGVTKRIYQDPHNNNGGNTPPSGSMARFRILGVSGNGEYIIRLDGTLSEFGFVAAADIPEGEGPTTGEQQFRESADTVFADEAWA